MIPANSVVSDAAELREPHVAVLRVGTDIQDISAITESIERYGRRYLDRVFTAQEVESCGGYDAEPAQLAPGLAARFCAKEATLKALRPVNIIPEWRDMEIVRMPGGWVRVSLTSTAQQLAEENELLTLEVSLAHDGNTAVATVVGMGRTAHDNQNTDERRQ